MSAPLLILVRARSPGPHLVREPTDRITVCGEVPIAPWGKTLSPGAMTCKGGCGPYSRELAAKMLAYGKSIEAHKKYRAGDLSGLLDSSQKIIRAKREEAWRPVAPLPPEELAKLPVAERVRRANVKIVFFELCARGWGKTFEELVWLLEVGIRTKDGRMLFAAPLREDAVVTAKDILDLFILPNLPEDICPEWKAGDAEFHFPATKAVLRFRGVNNESKDRLRGPGYHAVVLDECGTMDDLKSVLGIVEPIASRLGGKVLLSTTPAETPGHESKDIYDECSREGYAATFTLLDNARLSWDQKAAALMEGVGAEAPEDVPAILAGEMLPRKTKTRRERFCLWVVEGERAIHPAWTDLEAKLTVRIERKAA